MKNHWAVTIGINQYQFFQPLSYAQRDAQALRNFLVGEAGFSAEQCLLLTDTSLPIQGYSTYPDRETIQRWINQLCQQYLQPGDLLWCFFSGYGVHYQGQDYLMPIEGHPADVLSTGIPMRSLFASLKAAPTETVLVMLDMNRSQGTLSRESAGTQTAELAQNLGITTVLSCQPGQFSRETSALKHGFFTAALLEGLRYQHCTTLAGLDRYLSDRLPELSEHHWRPTQEPLTVVNPPERIHQIILPTNGTAATLWDTPANQEDRELIKYPATSSPAQPANLAANGRTPAASVVRQAPATAYTHSVLNGSSGHPSFNPDVQAVGKPTAIASPADASTAADSTEANAIDPLFWRRLLLGGGGLLLALMIGVFMLNKEALVGSSTAKNPASTAIANRDPSLPTENQALPTTKAQALIQPSQDQNQASSSSGATPAEAATSPASTGNRSNSAAGVPTAVSSGDNPDQAKSAREQTSGARQVVPKAIASPSSSGSRSGSKLLLKNQRPSQALLADARAKTLIKPSQASRLNQAIALARRIQPGDPLYGQAQQEVNRWSQGIFDLAQERAKQGQLNPAIAAARLVPQAHSQYPEAQQAIARWQSQLQQQRDNQVLLEAAAGLIVPGQASSYNRAITAASRIQPGQPQYAESQRLIAQWSQTIFEIAQYRAAQGRRKAAIQTATLVPEKAPIHTTAQKAIALWQRQ